MLVSISKRSTRFGTVFIDASFEEIIVPAIWEAATFIAKVGDENRRTMWTFQDQGNRNVCLIPEVTGLIQEMWQTEWSKRMKTRNVFYATRCYRYERPQLGRYREFTQFGIEMLGSTDMNFAKSLLVSCLDRFAVEYKIADNVKRGLNYYIEDGFEASVESLGAQKQIAGGGAYAEGVGWAIGVDRLMLAIKGV